MYVRWKVQKPRVSHAMPQGSYQSTGHTAHIQDYKTKQNAKLGALLIATLVESTRIHGQPRQKQIAYLGSIRERHIDKPLAVERFYQKVQERLGLLDLDTEQREKVIISLQVRVPLPSQELLEQTHKDYNAFLAAMP